MEHNRTLKMQWYSIVLLGCSILFALILSEITIRLVGHIDTDGNFYLGTLKCYPYHLPVKKIQININKYLASKTSYVAYDQHLGWAPRPASKSENGLYFYNKDAIRTPSCSTVILKSPSPGVLRILIFGDSFTHGDDVPFNNTWGYYLQESLKKNNIDAEVLNFGVGGYGMDQAYLRWKTQGRFYNPSIVIFGLQMENMNRNVNLMRALYYPAYSMPFAKPRFVLNQNNLSLINDPTPSPQRIVAVMNNFNSWKFSKYEYWYDCEEYKDNLFFRSRLIAFVYSCFRNHFLTNRTSHEDLEKLSFKIISSFKNSVEETGVKFYVVYLPLGDDIKSMKNNKTIPHSNFLQKLSDIVPIIHTEKQLINNANDIKTFIPRHYSGKANKVVADVIAKFIIKNFKKS